MKEYANSHTAVLEPDEEQENDNIVVVPVFINGNEAVAYITVKEARNRGILTLVRDGEDDASRSELKARMKKQFCELLILEKVLRPMAVKDN